MPSVTKSPSYKGLAPASPRSAAAGRGASRKTDTQPELALRRALWAMGLRYRKAPKDLPGRPDIVFRSAKLAVFCDGDFWHGKGWPARRAKLARGHNAAYWIAKIERNIARDAEIIERLGAAGWMVLRFWESDIRAAPVAVARTIQRALDARDARR